MRPRPSPAKRTIRSVLAAGLLAAATLAPAVAEEMKGMEMKGMETPSSAVAGNSQADRAFAASMRTMMKNMDVKPTGNPDKDFVAMMLPHHEGAVDMAKVELKFGKDPLLLKLAADIVKAQEDEIAEMQRWTAQHP